MPTDEKKHHKRLVTEELVSEPSTPAVSEPEPQSEAVESPVVEEQKTFLGVPETDNFDSTLKKPEGGVFFKFFLVTFFATLLALALAGGIYVYLTGTKGVNLKNIVNSQTPTPVSTDTPMPSASPASNIDVSTLKVSVLNGNGGIGVASAAKTVIEKAGFKVSNLGNADSFDFTDTLIQVKPSISADIAAKMKDALSTNYSVKIGDSLDAKSNFDIVVTVGSK